MIDQQPLDTDSRSPCRESSRPRLLVAFGMILGISLTCFASNAGFKVLDASTRLTDGVYRVYADVAFNFSAEALEAMENGVALTVSIDMQVLQLNPVLDRNVATVKALYRIQSHALSRHYVVRDLSTGESTTYLDFDEMTSQLGKINGLPLLDDHLLEPNQQYRVRLRASLERESLPTPLRLLAYFSSAWRLSSDWTTWRLQR